MSAPTSPLGLTPPPGLETCIEIALEARSQALITEAVRMAYALGVFDGTIQLAKTQISSRAAAVTRNGASTQ